MIYPDGIFVESSSLGFRVIVVGRPMSQWVADLGKAREEAGRLALVFGDFVNPGLFELVAK